MAIEGPLAAVRIEPIQPVIGSDPEDAGVVFHDAAQLSRGTSLIGGQRVVQRSVAIKAQQAICAGQPQEALAILKEAVHFETRGQVIQAEKIEARVER